MPLHENTSFTSYIIIKWLHNWIVYVLFNIYDIYQMPQNTPVLTNLRPVVKITPINTLNEKINVLEVSPLNGHVLRSE